MKFSVQWLQEWLTAKVGVATLADTFNQSGLEVESVVPAAGSFQGVVVGEIVTETMHPDAKRLHCCQVNLGEGVPMPIVCGGVNVRPGLKVAVATIGAKLPGGIIIQQTTLRGQPSHGMICSAHELGLGEDKEGCILELPQDAPIGKDLREYLQLDDQVIDIALTANRGDCLSINGIAREVAASLKVVGKSFTYKPVLAQITDAVNIELMAAAKCPRYLGRIIRHINHRATTPIWMQERLRRSGIRSIHPVVDVTNYVMLELGQPMHAFNLEHIADEIQVRQARPGENLTLLDGQSLSLNAEDLVIADRERPLALAGIMGGTASGVSADTSHLFLESAFFAQVPLSLTARRYGLQSDSAYRFARGVDFNLPLPAMERATQLLLDIVGGQAGPVIEKVDTAYLPKPAVIALRREQILRLLGVELTDQQVTEILQSLHLGLAPQPWGWEVQVPSYRYDLTLEVDLIEELGRLYGYQHIPSQTMAVAMQAPQLPETQIPRSRLLTLLADRGYCEAITYSFVSPRWQEQLDPEHPPITLANPISNDMSVMRTSLWPGLLQALQHNQNRQYPRVRLFEVGLCFFQQAEGQLQQTPMLGGVVTGLAYPEQWGVAARPVDFFDVKADIEALLALSGSPSRYNWRAGRHPALHPGQNAELWWGEQRIGHIGALHPMLVESCEVNGPVYLFELMYDSVSVKQPIEFKIISKFPGVRRDIAVTIDQTLPAAALEKFIVKKAGKLLNNVQIFDVYQGQNIKKGQKSVALGLVFQDAARTLKDEEVQVVVDDLIKGLEQEFNAKLRM